MQERKTHVNRRTFGLSMVASAFLGQGSHAAETWPGNNPVTLVIPYAAGGGIDILARAATEQLHKDTGGTFITVNKPGATTTLAARHVAKAPPDGRTLLLGNVVTFCMAPFSIKAPGYEATKDFEHITMIGESLYILLGNARWASLDALVAEAKKRPGQLSYATWGVGSTAHLFMLDLIGRTGIELVHVPYNGSQPALTDLIGGRIDIMLCPQATGNQHVQSGRVNAFAVSNKNRSASLPKVPNFEEIGLRGLRSPGWISLDAPAGTPASVIKTVADSARTAFSNPTTRAMLEKVGMGEVEFGADAEKARIKADTAYFRELFARAGVVPE